MTVTSIEVAAVLCFISGIVVTVIIFAGLLGRTERIRKRAAEETSVALLGAFQSLAAQAEGERK